MHVTEAKDIKNMSNKLNDFIFYTVILPVDYSLKMLRTEILKFIIYYILIFFYIVLFASIIQESRPRGAGGNYLYFFAPGLLVLTIIGSISSKILELWYNASAYKLMAYWISLPLSTSYWLYLFTINILFNSLIYTLPLLMLLIYLDFTLLQFINIIIILLTTSVFFFYIMFILVLKLFNTDYVFIFQQLSQPLLTRLSPVFYSIIFIPVAVLPLVYANPFTWVVMGMRDRLLGSNVAVLLLILDIITFKYVIFYWKSKIRVGDLIN